MFVRMGLLSKKENLAQETFRDYWINTHGDIGKRLPGLTGYHQNHIINSEQLGINYKRGPEKFDGISQLWFDDNLNSMKESFQSNIGKKLKADEVNFLDNVKIVTAKQNPVIPVRKNNLIKRMSILKK